MTTEGALPAATGAAGPGSGQAVVLLNYGHPLTPAQMDAVRRLTGTDDIRVLDLGRQADPVLPFAAQAAELADAAGLDPETWQTAPLILNPPTLHVLAVAILAEIHGRAGYFVPVLRLRPVAGAVPPRFEVAEILDLQAIRSAARGRRG